MYTLGNGDGATLTGLEASVQRLSEIKSTLDDLFTSAKVVLQTQHGSIERSCRDLTLGQFQILLTLLGITSTETPSTTAAATSAGAPPVRTTETASEPSGDNTPSTGPSHAASFTKENLTFDPVYDLDQLSKDDLIWTTFANPDGQVARIMQIDNENPGDLKVRATMAKSGSQVWLSLSDIKGVKQ